VSNVNKTINRSFLGLMGQDRCVTSKVVSCVSPDAGRRGGWS
jgi:hypothetical protein